MIYRYGCLQFVLTPVNQSRFPVWSTDDNAKNAPVSTVMAEQQANKKRYHSLSTRQPRFHTSAERREADVLVLGIRLLCVGTAFKGMP
jgi:hypothetical protein